eukprot:6456839-Amphidinium_carterae.1
MNNWILKQVRKSVEASVGSSSEAFSRPAATERLIAWSQSRAQRLTYFSTVVTDLTTTASACSAKLQAESGALTQEGFNGV